MGMDPVSWAMIASAAAGVAGTAYTMTNKPKPPKPASPPPAPSSGIEEGAASKVRKYRPAAQLFKDEDLRLGGAGKLGL